MPYLACYDTQIKIIYTLMSTIRFLFFICLSCLFIITGNKAFALEITNIRFGDHPDKLRTVIELDQATDFKVFTLSPNESNPYRIVVDLPRFSWSAGTIKKPKSLTVSEVRSGDLGSGFMRVVFDMTSPPSIKNSFLLPASGSKPYRLVIDSQNTSTSGFAQTSQKTFGSLNAKSNAVVNTIDDLDILSIFKPSTGIVPKRKPRDVATTTKPTSPLRKPLIVIDAGHGGADPGAVGAGRIREKDITLSAARILKKELQSTGRYRVLLTRSDDRYLKLHQRRSIARQKEADLFISLHADSINKSNVRGASIYTLSNKASDAQTAKLAARENQADLIAGVDLRHEDKEVANILIDLAMRDTMNQSKFFANTVVDKFGAYSVRVLPRPHRYAGFAVLKSPDVPSVLVEMGFMSNSHEAKLLTTHDYQQKIANALRRSIDSYFEKVRKNAL